jgi:hypothetical protein
MGDATSRHVAAENVTFEAVGVLIVSDKGEISAEKTIKLSLESIEREFQLQFQPGAHQSVTSPARKPKRRRQRPSTTTITSVPSQSGQKKRDEAVTSV